MKTPFTAGAVWDAMRAAPGSTVQELERATGLSHSKVEDAVIRLRRSGHATYQRIGRAAHWTARGERPIDYRDQDFAAGCATAKAEDVKVPLVDGCTLAQVWR